MATPGSVKTDRLSDKDAKEESEDQSNWRALPSSAPHTYFVQMGRSPCSDTYV